MNVEAQVKVVASATRSQRLKPATYSTGLGSDRRQQLGARTIVFGQDRNEPHSLRPHKAMKGSRVLLTRRMTMKHRWLVCALCACTLVVLLAASALPIAGAGHSKTSTIGATQLHPSDLIDRGAPPASFALTSQGWTTLLSEGFEGDFPGSTWATEGDPTWGRSTYRAHEGSGSAYCAGGGEFGVEPPGPYLEDMVSWMVAGPFDLSQATEAELSFAHWTETEPEQRDLFAVMASADGENWDGPSWSGDLYTACNGWCSETLLLSDFPGLGNLCGHSQVWLGFAFYSDSYVVYEGTYVDGIVLRAYSEEAGTITPTATNTHPPDATATATPTATNTGLPTSTTTHTPTATNTHPADATPTVTPTATATRPPSGPIRVYLPVMRRSMPGGGQSDALKRSSLPPP